MSFESESNYSLKDLIDALHKNDISQIEKILKQNPSLLIKKTKSNRNIFEYMWLAQEFYEDDDLDLYPINLKLINFLFNILEAPKKDSLHLNSKDKRYWKKVLKFQLKSIKINSKMEKRELDNYLKRFKKL